MNEFLTFAALVLALIAVWILRPRLGRRNAHGIGYGSMKPAAPPPTPEPGPLKCAYCQGTEFYEGPSGGAAINILCANPACRHWFNYCPAIGYVEDLNRVEPEAPKVIKAAGDDGRSADR